MKRDIDKFLEIVGVAQRTKLEENNHKPGFDEVDLKTGFDQTADEMIELYKEIRKLDYCKLNKELLNWIKYEAADVANCAGIIICRCEHLLREVS